MQAVHDVSYLLEPDVTRSVIYRYRTGVLAPQMKASIEQALADRGEALRAVLPEEIGSTLFGVNLIEQFIGFCKWPLLRSREVARSAEALLAGLSSLKANRIMLFADAHDPIFQHQHWPDAARNCIVIDEVSATTEVAPDIIRFFWATTDLPFCILDHTATTKFLRSVVTSDPDLGSFLERCERRLIIDYDEVQGALRELETEGDLRSRNEMLRPLRRLIDQRRGDAIQELVASAADRLRDRAWTVAELSREILRAARELLGAPDFKARGKSVDSTMRRRFVLSVAVLLTARRLAVAGRRGDDLLGPRPDASIAEFERLYRDCCRRLTTVASEDYLVGCWDELRHLLSSYSDFQPKRWLTQEERLIEAMYGCLENVDHSPSGQGWVTRLASLVKSAVELRRQREREYSESIATPS